MRASHPRLDTSLVMEYTNRDENWQPKVDSAGRMMAAGESHAAGAPQVGAEGAMGFALPQRTQKLSGIRTVAGRRLWRASEAPKE